MISSDARGLPILPLIRTSPEKQNGSALVSCCRSPFGFPVRGPFVSDTGGRSSSSCFYKFVFVPEDVASRRKPPPEPHCPGDTLKGRRFEVTREHSQPPVHSRPPPPRGELSQIHNAVHNTKSLTVSLPRLLALCSVGCLSRSRDSVPWSNCRALSLRNVPAPLASLPRVRFPPTSESMSSFMAGGPRQHSPIEAAEGLALLFVFWLIRCVVWC